MVDVMSYNLYNSFDGRMSYGLYNSMDGQMLPQDYAASEQSIYETRNMRTVGIRRYALNAASDQKCGIGIKFTKTDYGPYMITALVPQGAAEQSKVVNVGDLIHEVDGQSVYNIAPEDVAWFITGIPGSVVNLTISDSPFAHMPAPAKNYGFPVRLMAVLRNNGTGNTGIGLTFAKASSFGPCVVASLSSGGNAALSGMIQVGDLIHEVGYVNVYSMSPMEVIRALMGKPGSPVFLLTSQGSRNYLPQNSGPVLFSVNRDSNGRIGFEFMKTPTGAFEVTRVIPNSPAANAGFIEGDLIHAINHLSIYDKDIVALTGMLLGEPFSTICISKETPALLTRKYNFPVRMAIIKRGPNVGPRVGLGLQFLKTSGVGPIVVHSLLPEGSAARSGQLQVGDIIHEIDKHSVYHMSIEQVANLILGTPGTYVRLIVSQNVQQNGAPVTSRVSSPVVDRI